MFQPFAKYVDFQGRARRSEYWLWFLFQIIVGFVFGALKGIVGTEGAVVIQLANAVFSLAILLPTLAVGVRRLHDTNRTGWWVAFPIAVAIAGVIFFIATQGASALPILQQLSEGGTTGSPALSNPAGMMSLVWVGLAYLLSWLVVFIFNVLDGTPGPNRFGPDPKGRGGNINVF